MYHVTSTIYQSENKMQHCIVVSIAASRFGCFSTLFPFILSCFTEKCGQQVVSGQISIISSLAPIDPLISGSEKEQCSCWSKSFYIFYQSFSYHLWSLSYSVESSNRREQTLRDGLSHSLWLNHVVQNDRYPCDARNNQDTCLSSWLESIRNFN